MAQNTTEKHLPKKSAKKYFTGGTLECDPEHNSWVVFIFAFKPCYCFKIDSYKKDLMHALLILGIEFFKNYLQKVDQEVRECWMVNGLFENCVKIVIFSAMIIAGEKSFLWLCFFKRIISQNLLKEVVNWDRSKGGEAKWLKKCLKFYVVTFPSVWFN